MSELRKAVEKFRIWFANLSREHPEKTLFTEGNDHLQDELIGVFHAIEAALAAESEQEPVAWIAENGNGQAFITVCNESEWRDAHPEGYNGYEWRPLYTHPLRELSDVEIKRLWDNHRSTFVMDFADFKEAIIAAEKGGVL